MCGIVGVLNQAGDPISPLLLQKMKAAIVHRGPDGEGFFHEANLGLAHCRLAIIDLSSAAHQPMISKDQRYVLIYNGEIYNFRQLRVELESLGCQFHSKSDTEVVLNAFAVWGSSSLDKFNGMFAFAIWDRVEKTLFLARDRYGIKPLYWFYKNGLFVFASEIKAILEHPDISAEVNPTALNQYFTFQNIFTEHTLFQNIHLLKPGSFLKITLSSSPDIYQYWDYVFSNDALISREKASDQLYHLFLQAVNRQLVADVPVGCYLSGGMDSGSITAIAAQQIPRLSAFTCGFDLSSASGIELAFDERASAEVMANSFKAEHYEVVLHAGDMEYVLPKLVWHLEDLRVGQCYPNYYVARLASKFVKVVLSGAGGDELFAGYPWRYFNGPAPIHFKDYCRQYYQFWQRLVPDQNKNQFFKAEFATAIKSYPTFEIFESVLNNWPDKSISQENLINASLYFELRTFLHGLLVVEDKLSMAHSLETRVPFLDNDLVDFALRIPLKYKMNDKSQQVSKLILRQAMSRLLPDEIINKKKQGFSAPDASWFRGESINYINRLLRDPKAKIYDFFQSTYIHTILDEHCGGKVNHRLFIWSLLSFEWWCRIFLEKQAISKNISLSHSSHFISEI